LPRGDLTDENDVQTFPFMPILFRIASFEWLWNASHIRIGASQETKDERGMFESRPQNHAGSAQLP
jgi:hypothetical protein